MTTATLTGDNSQFWKLLTVLLALFLALSIAALGIESYFFYRSMHPVQEPFGKKSASTAPHNDSVLPPLNSSSSLNTAPWPTDDWDLSNPKVSVGNPWDQLNHLHQQMNQLFNDTFSQIPMDNASLFPSVSSPNLDIREESDHYTVRVDMPGAKKESIKVNIEGRLLTISGERTSVSETKNSDRVVRSERSMAEFVRTIQLPGPVSDSAVDAKYDNGVLTIQLPKSSVDGSGTQVPVH